MKISEHCHLIMAKSSKTFVYEIVDIHPNFELNKLKEFCKEIVSHGLSQPLSYNERTIYVQFKNGRGVVTFSPASIFLWGVSFLYSFLLYLYVTPVEKGVLAKKN